MAPGYRTGQVNKTPALRRSQRPFERKLPESHGTEESHLPAPGEKLAGSLGNYSN